MSNTGYHSIVTLLRNYPEMEGGREIENFKIEKSKIFGRIYAYTGNKGIYDGEIDDNTMYNFECRFFNNFKKNDRLEFNDNGIIRRFEIVSINNIAMRSKRMILKIKEFPNG